MTTDAKTLARHIRSLRGVAAVSHQPGGLSVRCRSAAAADRCAEELASEGKRVARAGRHSVAVWASDARS